MQGLERKLQEEREARRRERGASLAEMEAASKQSERETLRWREAALEAQREADVLREKLRMEQGISREMQLRLEVQT